MNLTLSDKMTVIPLMEMDMDQTSGDMIKDGMPQVLPLLVLRNAVVFPGTLIPITVGREKSIKLVRESLTGDKWVGTVTQMDPLDDDPEENEISDHGCLAKILKIIEMPEGGITVILHGFRRFKIDRIVQKEPYFAAQVIYLNDIHPAQDDRGYKAVVDGIKDVAAQIFQLTPSIPREAEFALRNIEKDDFLVNFVASNIYLDGIKDKLALLSIDKLNDRASRLLELLYKHLELLKFKEQIQQKVRGEIDQQQKEYYLSNQLKTIQDELGLTQDMEEVDTLREKAANKKWSKEIAEIFEKEVQKLERANPHQPDYAIQLNYLQFMVELPWGEYTKDNLDLKRARRVLDKDHSGLETVKERILEHLAVLKLKGDMKSPILCLYGPPGVGKTSLGKSVARALGRNFARISLGGLHDESEIRGHRRTYIGAMPGRIIQSIKRSKTSNPVVVLDEIDKVGTDFRGDPSSALLEVLDPEQNNTFHDNYLDVDYDLSRVLFITTANNIGGIQPALRDRMEMIPINGYLAEEKRTIALKHLLPKQLEAHGLKPSQIKLGRQSIDVIINEYTRESGVRNLDKQLAKVARHVAKKIAFGEEYDPVLTPENIREILGVHRIIQDVQKGNEFPGVVTGLAWTETGGEILFVETSLSKGKGTLTTTGSLGDVMKESAIIAQQYLKAHADMLGLDPGIFESTDIHLHVPEGAIPKDGPSAGITMICSMASSFLNKCIKKGVAMTGEITLRGRILPVGGIKEKILAAKRSGIKTIILSEDNRKDIEEIKPDFIKGLEFKFMKTIPEVIKYVL
ncbi:MAG TPA: endopeptidase La [Bacteroidales bacterium]|jgi:ATP-dependent Lon protease|nr:endopeptidase La [Bacteroidales bacterium]MCZ2416086.1 endopeptidase La [Burkholderiales bacterium]MBP8999785.1 endopeptidase La [Bacteroidales bacterium]MCZ2317285.1 endopeptidase La [Bacteroidales bacterium]NLZ08985.1 endopeptidase La [Bacteroidales bacterium]